VYIGRLPPSSDHSSPVAAPDDPETGRDSPGKNVTPGPVPVAARKRSGCPWARTRVRCKVGVMRTPVRPEGRSIMTTRLATAAGILLLALAATPPARGGAAPAAADEARAVIVEKCLACHAGEKPK